MNKIPVYASTVSAGLTGTVVTKKEKSDSLGLYVSAIAGKFASAVVLFTVEQSPTSGLSTFTSYFYDYPNKTPAACAVTISTAGFYELPRGSEGDFVRISFDVATTQVFNVVLTTPKTTF